MSKPLKLIVAVLCCSMLQACLGTIVGATADVAIEIVKVPFKVGGAVIDVVSGDGKKKSSANDGDDD